MSDENSKEVVRALFDATNSGDLDAVLAVIGDEIVVHTAVPGIVPGRDGFRGFMEIFLRAFPGVQTDVHTIIQEGDLVAVRHTHRGAHTGEFGALPPSGRAFAVDGLELFRVRDGKIVEMWHHDDLLGLMQQIGALPASPEPAA